MSAGNIYNPTHSFTSPNSPETRSLLTFTLKVAGQFIYSLMLLEHGVQK